ncbi:low temperature requirement protein A, partial [Schumannella luteola]
DTDDWFVRLMTLVQMVGVIFIALGIPDVFRSMEEGTLDNTVVVLGYVVMRLGLLPLWIRVAVQDPTHRRPAIVFSCALVVAQCGWVAVAFLHLPLAAAVPVTILLYLVELTGPIVAERVGAGTPWHPHHVAERYGLLVIITLGEVVLGTASTISAVVQESGWTLDAGLVAFAGTSLAFALWWVYFTVPAARVLTRYRARIPLGVRAHRGLRMPGGRRRRTRCGRTRERRPRGARHHRSRRGRRDPRRRPPAGDLHAVLAPHGRLRHLPPAARRHRAGAAGGLRRRRRRRRAPVGVVGAGRRRTGRGDRRIRDDRSPPPAGAPRRTRRLIQKSRRITRRRRVGRETTCIPAASNMPGVPT